MTLKIAVGIATAGRRQVLTKTIRHLTNQKRPADELLICPALPSDLDLDCLDNFPSVVRITSGKIGSSAQRNLLIDASTADVIVFFDDDFLPDERFLLEVERLFEDHTDVVVATGNVLADGISGPGFSHDEGVALLASRRSTSLPALIKEVNNGYGCNMAVRLASVKANEIIFDERLPRYSWLEDVDFSRQLARLGRIVKAYSLEGVHLGTKRSGRSSGKSLGYSQIANRIYIMRKGNMSKREAVDGNLRNILANLTRSFKPEPWVDRRGRLLGNCIALRDWLTGKLDPEKILKF